MYLRQVLAISCNAENAHLRYAHSARQLPCADASLFGKDDMLTRRDFYLFWEDARAWLTDRGVYLYETYEEPVGNIYHERWIQPVPLIVASSTLPYSSCLLPDPSDPTMISSVVRWAEAFRAVLTWHSCYI